jgi:hypothetical protein
MSLPNGQNSKSGLPKIKKCRFRLKDVLLDSRTRGTGKRTGLIGAFDRYLEFLKRSYEMHLSFKMKTPIKLGRATSNKPHARVWRKNNIKGLTGGR